MEHKKDGIATVHLVISGKVQGVFFRGTAKMEASKINVKGWIRNTHAGDVEATVSGLRSDIEKFIEWCNEGPESAEVHHVEVQECSFVPFDEFIVIRGKS